MPSISTLLFFCLDFAPLVSSLGFLREDRRSTDEDVFRPRIGLDCWQRCNRRAGSCAWCGRGGACCRKGHPSDPDECIGTSQHNYRTDHHECVPEPSKWERDLHLDPSIFIAVFSRRGAYYRRSYVRRLWSRVARDGNDVVVKFAICDRGFDRVDDMLHAEQASYGDVLFLQCEEGYREGRLTKKVIAAMQAYRADPAFGKAFFMKIDDDSFLAWDRFSTFLKWHATPNAYMGVPINQSIPCRNETSRWYEPRSTFTRELYPVGYAGGSGYVLGRALVDAIFERRIPEKHLLWNEDRAVSVWMDGLSHLGVPVDFISLPGISGFWGWNWQHPTQQWGTWQQYSYLVHHGLRGVTINCLAGVEEGKNPLTGLKRCFSLEDGQEYALTTCAWENTAAARLLASKMEEGTFSSLPNDMRQDLYSHPSGTHSSHKKSLH
mmetsp:Transcript_11951/g.32315  ORF Transcript_11951/g.32315 Transcript_11951/m.32315 type:complete len:435 (+) Transcript_11951:138-1442(+)